MKRLDTTSVLQVKDLELSESTILNAGNT